MMQSILINHNENNNIGTLTLDTDKKTCKITLNKNGEKYKKALQFIIKTITKQMNKNYRNENLIIHNADKDFFTALKQELLLTLDISTKTVPEKANEKR